MYPTVYILLGADDLLKAERIDVVDVTDEVQEMLNNYTRDDLRDPETWSKLMVICRLQPDNDVLPVRSNYGNKQTYNIGLNYVTSEVPLWYTLPDLIASKLYTGKAPVIEEAIRFVPVGRRLDLKEVEVLGMRISPEDNLIKQLIDRRMELKARMADASPEERIQLDIRQNAIKIIANTICYGIYIEMNPEKCEPTSIQVHGLESFTTKVEKLEQPGPMFNPVIGTMMTAGARLFLAATETLVLEHGRYFAYCDTDSTFISPEHVQLVQDHFRSLNPYNHDVEMVKVESDDEGNPLEDVWFYGISAKRYVLYQVEDVRDVRDIRIKKYSSHGLGHLLDIDEEAVWEDILAIHYEPSRREEILAKYDGQPAVSRMTISKASLHKRLATLNKGKPYDHQVKPSNFVLVGTAHRKDPETGDPIHPMAPFVSPSSPKFRSIQYQPFIDYHTGRIYTEDTELYWKSLRDVIEAYMDHPETKSVGDVGLLARRSLTVELTGVKYIGKESNELDESVVLGVGGDACVHYRDFKAWIGSLTTERARKLGIYPQQLYYWRKKVRNGEMPRRKSKIWIVFESDW